MSLTERIIQLARDTDEIEGRLWGLCRPELGLNLPLPDDAHLTYVIDGSNMDIEPEPVTCPICKPFDKYHNLYMDTLSVYGFFQKNNHKAGLCNAQEGINRAMDEARKTMRWALKMWRSKDHLKCASCGKLIGEGHFPEMIEIDGKFYCETCPINYWDYKKSTNRSAGYWMKPPRYSP